MGSRGEKHISRLAMPKSWPIKRKGVKWITRPLPGAHSIKSGLSLNLVFRNLLGYAKTTKEVKNILYNQEILVNGIRRKDVRFIVGLMDIIGIPKLKKYFRVLLDKRGKLALAQIKSDEANILPCRIEKKAQLKKKKTQLNLCGGRNILVEKNEYKIGDTVILELPSQKITHLIKLEKGNLIYLTGGKHTGAIGIIEGIKAGIITYKREKSTFETLAKYAFVIGKEKPVISLLEK